jgi:hypothetical protein
MNRFAVSTAVTLSCVIATMAKNLIKGDPMILDRTNSNCEINSLHTDGFRQEAESIDGLAFVIFRPGKGENITATNRRYNLTSRFLRRRKSYDPAKFVFGRGEPANGPGRIEFYYGGKLRMVIIAPKNGMPCMDCCDFPWWADNDADSKRSVLSSLFVRASK